MARKTGQAATAKAALAVLDRLPVAFALFDSARRLAGWNARLASLCGFPKGLLTLGTPLDAFLRAEAAQDGHGARRAGAHVRKRLEELKRRTSARRELRRPDGRILGVSHRPVPPGQLLLCYEDVTEARLARDKAREALERQMATSEILRAISSSPTDVQPVLDTIAEHAALLCGALHANVFLQEGDMLRPMATYSHEGGSEIDRTDSVPIRRMSVNGRAFLERRTNHVEDLAALVDTEYSDVREYQRRFGMRTALAVPMIREGNAIGTIYIWRREVRPFSKEDIALLETFADQAVIAIENVRLFNETKEALERQTATAEILRVISRSPTDVQPVFETIAECAMRLLGAWSVLVTRFDGELLHFGATRGGPPDSEKYLREQYPRRPGPDDAVSERCILERATQHVADCSTHPIPLIRDRARIRGYRAILAVPMLRDSEPIGAIGVSRKDPGAFPEADVELLKTFADQAVIAIENVRLFNETKEALERQTATAEILRVISGSPMDTQPVFDAILERATRLCDAETGILFRYEDGAYHALAKRVHNPAFAELFKQPRRPPPDSKTGLGRLIREKRAVHIPDISKDAAFAEGDPMRLQTVAGGMRAWLGAPLLKDGELIGAIVIYRTEPRPFSDQQVSLLQTFADQAVIAIENVRLFNETREALERQTATAEILRVISSTPTDTQPVFDAIVESTQRLIPGKATHLLLRRESQFVLAAYSGAEMKDVPEQVRTAPLDRDKNFPSRAILDGEVVHVTDWEGDDVPEFEKIIGKVYGIRSGLIVPLLRGAEGIGAIAVTRELAGPYHEREISLLQSFADQAVIAIENVRLFNETKEALERQTATAEVLRVISGSPTDTQPVFDSIVRSCQRLFGGQTVALALIADGQIVPRAGVDKNGAPLDFAALPPWPLDRGSATGASVLDNRALNLSDLSQVADTLPRMKDLALRIGYRSGLWVPLRREDGAIGVLSVLRRTTGAFAEQEVALAQTFADQAVIAIENVRLFNETKEALERQTATAEILKVISSSPIDVQPVFDAIVRSAVRLCGSVFGVLIRFDGKLLDLVAHHNFAPETVEMLRRAYPMLPSLDQVSGRAIINRAVAEIPDAQQDPTYRRQMASDAGYRSTVGVPMLRDGIPLGAIVVAWKEPSAYTEKQIALLKTFADQAVIAIENVRLFNETKEALERQTATAEILRVISSSPTDTQPVFDAIVKSGVRLFNGQGVGILLVDGDRLQIGSAGGIIDLESARKRYPLPLNRDTVSGQAILDRSFVNIADSQAPEMPELLRTLGRELDYRAIAAAPMMREGVATGSITVVRKAAGALAEKEVALLKTFADQAVIAIENVRLFKELQARTEALTKSVGQLTALGEVGQAISSTLELETVLQTIVTRAVQLAGLDGGSIYEYDERAQEFRLQAAENMEQEVAEDIRKAPTRKGDGALGRTAVTLEPTQVPDTLDDSYQSARKELLVRAGYRALLAVPLLREDHLLGALLVNRKTPGPFAPEIVELLKTFASQSALAIQNARLFREIAEKGKQLEVASRHKSDFLASMSHELRTPLNAILGFNEMILGQVYGEVPKDLHEPLTDIQTSGKHLLRLINNVLDLAKIEAGRMELALSDYSVHDTVESVRATLRPLAADKGLEFVTSVPADLPLAYGDPGRLTQCLMNLAGNSLKFTKAGKVEISVELNDGVLVYRVADTGIGIPPEKIGSLFTEFKQTDATIASEYGGTGLGLSISKKFIEMHGGRIWVESEPGKGSSFIFRIPLRTGEGKAA